MRLPARFIFSVAALAALALCAGASLQAQNSNPEPSSSAEYASLSAPNQNPPAGPSTSQTPGQAAAQTPGQAAGNGTYVATNPLAGVTYDNRFDLSLGMAYDHMKAGPSLLEGANLGGLNLTGSMWLTQRWGIQATQRTYVGTSGTGINDANSNGGPIKGPFVAEYFLLGGPEWLGPHNQHGAILAHVLFGGVYGDFERDLLSPTAQFPNPAQRVSFYNDQFAPAAIAGGSFDLNRSARWVFRITPDAVVTHYGINYPPNTKQFDVNFAISVGMEYKFKKKR